MQQISVCSLDDIIKTCRISGRVYWHNFQASQMRTEIGIYKFYLFTCRNDYRITFMTFQPKQVARPCAEYSLA